jgi:hypothetical protein
MRDGVPHLTAARWGLVGAIAGTFLVTLLGFGLVLLGPYLVAIPVAIALPAGLIVGGLAVSPRTRRGAVWVLMAFILLLGWFGGLGAASPGSKATRLLRPRWRGCSGSSSSSSR